MDASAPQITIIVPTRNEAENIEPLLDRLRDSLSGHDFEVVFVDDSNDDTAAVLEQIQYNYPFAVRVIARTPAERNGLSGAVVDGMRSASGEWLCVMDADLQHPPDTITALWAQAQKSGADIVVGSRRGDLFGPYGLSRLRSLNSKLLTIFARSLFPRLLKNASDPLTGLFLVRRSAVNIEALRPDGFKILLEILVRSPDLQVSEVHFDFAPRHSGESKADVREGVRFFRHLLILRGTANPHMGRFIALAVVAFAANVILVTGLLRFSQLVPVVAVLVAAELSWLFIFLGFEFWVFSERDQTGRRRRFWGFFLLSQLAILLVFLPLYAILTIVFNMAVLTANSLSFSVVALVRYLLSEQWVVTRGGLTWQPQSYYYSLHGILRIESHVPLRELAHFQTELDDSDVDIQVRIDRQGTPTPLTGGISYDDQLGRFGFGLSVLPGSYTQVVVSPLLESSPEFLFTNIIEPILRWRLVSEGFVLVKAASVAKDGQAVLICADQDLGPLISQLCLEEGYGFQADDLTLLDAAGNVYCYPKPVTVNRAMLDDSPLRRRASERLSFAGQRLLYTRLVRRAGLWLSRQDLPAATVNTYLQRFIPQPKYELTVLYPGTEIVDRARLAGSVFDTATVSSTPTLADIMTCLQQSETIAAFQPHPLLAQRFRTWQGDDLIRKECEIIEAAMIDVPVRAMDLAKEPTGLQNELEQATPQIKEA